MTLHYVTLFYSLKNCKFYSYTCFPLSQSNLASLLVNYEVLHIFTFESWTEYWPLSEYLCPDEECTTMNLDLFSRRSLQSCLTASLNRYEMNWSFTNPGLATRIHFTTEKHIHATQISEFICTLSILITWIIKKIPSKTEVSKNALHDSLIKSLQCLKENTVSLYAYFEIYMQLLRSIYCSTCRNNSCIYCISIVFLMDYSKKKKQSLSFAQYNDKHLNALSDLLSRGFIGSPCHVEYNCLSSCGGWWPQPLPLVRSWLESREPDWPDLPASQQQQHLLSERGHMPAL